MTQNFQEQIKNAMLRHENTFIPKIINRENVREKRPNRIAQKKKYREENKDELNRKHREYNASEHGKSVNQKYNKEWRELNSEYDKKRKSDWWEKKFSVPGAREEYNRKRREKNRLKREQKKQCATNEK